MNRVHQVKWVSRSLLNKYCHGNSIKGLKKKPWVRKPHNVPKANLINKIWHFIIYLSLYSYLQRSEVENTFRWIRNGQYIALPYWQPSPETICKCLCRQAYQKLLYSVNIVVTLLGLRAGKNFCPRSAFFNTARKKGSVMTFLLGYKGLYREVIYVSW